MKTTLFTLFAALLSISAAAQSTTLYIDLTVERQEIVAGPYARYAQKYLGVTAPLADKVLLQIVAANIQDTNDLEREISTLETTGNQTEVQHMYPSFGFPKLTIDKGSAAPESLEDSARKAASRIFEIRRNRFELITGMAGENVFGAGLKAALDKLDELEQDYLSLFFGRQTTQLIDSQHRVTPTQGLTTYTVAKFSTTEGLLPSDSDEGAAVVLTLRPIGSATAAGLRTVDKPSSKTTTVRIPVDVECRISLDDNELTTSVLPVAQFGRTVYLVQ